MCALSLYYSQTQAIFLRQSRLLSSVNILRTVESCISGIFGHSEIFHYFGCSFYSINNKLLIYTLLHEFWCPKCFWQIFCHKKSTHLHHSYLKYALVKTHSKHLQCFCVLTFISWSPWFNQYLMTLLHITIT